VPRGIVPSLGALRARLSTARARPAAQAHHGT